MAGKRKNPELLTFINPSKRPELKKALRRYRQFHGQDPVEVTRRGKGKRQLILIVLGRLCEIVYEPTTGERRRIQWFHKFRDPDARLATDAEGKRLYIVTGKGKVVDFSRGIIA